MKSVDYTKLSQKERKKVREEYIIFQKNKCIFCNEDLYSSPAEAIQQTPINLKLFPPNFLKHPIHLQHNHENNMTEGAVHARCNAVLWQYFGK